MSDLIILLLIPIIGFVYCILRKRSAGYYVGWSGIFLILLALCVMKAGAGELSIIMFLMGIGLLVLLCSDPFSWFMLSRLHMENKYPELYGKKQAASNSYTSQTSTSYNNYSSSPTSSYSPTKKGSYTELVSDTSMRSIYSQFFGAVCRFQEINGSGSIRIKKNKDGETVQFFGQYCNYENMDCSSRLGFYLSFPGLYMPGSGESGDLFQYSLEKVKCSDYEFGIQDILSELHNQLPHARITGQTSREDYCSVQFQT